MITDINWLLANTDRLKRRAGLQFFRVPQMFFGARIMAADRRRLAIITDPDLDVNDMEISPFTASHIKSFKLLPCGSGAIVDGVEMRGMLHTWSPCIENLGTKSERYAVADIKRCITAADYVTLPCGATVYKTVITGFLKYAQEMYMQIRYGDCITSPVELTIGYRKLVALPLRVGFE